MSASSERGPRSSPLPAAGSDSGPSLESLEIDLLLEGIAQRYGYDFRDYARASLARRIHNIVQRENLATVSALQERLLRDHAFMMSFVESISVHITSMFRDPDVYELIRSRIVPLLRTYPFVRIWHAGCSSGEEVYSLAMLLQEEGVYDRCRIYATDISDAVLERARRGIFPLRAMTGYASAYLQSGGRQDFSSYYLADGQSAIVRASLKQNLIFSQHNLACDGVFNEFQLIMCRNVGIYFNQALRERMHRLLHDSTSSFGMLVLGKKESMRFTPYERSYEELVEGLRVYRRTR